jgi:hypothetical protein
MHCGEVEGFITVCAAATCGNAKSGAKVHAAVIAISV